MYLVCYFGENRLNLKFWCSYEVIDSGIRTAFHTIRNDRKIGHPQGLRGKRLGKCRGEGWLGPVRYVKQTGKISILIIQKSQIHSKESRTFIQNIVKLFTHDYKICVIMVQVFFISIVFFTEA